MKLPINSKKICYLILSSTIISSTLLFTNPISANESRSDMELVILEAEENGIDINHTTTIEKIQEYIQREFDRHQFASLHIDREEDPFGTVVLSFTEELPPNKKEEILSFVEEPTKVSFRVVSYTEDQLIEQQRLIDSVVFGENVFSTEGITVFHTGTDIVNNKVEIGISPYNEQTVQTVFNYFDSEMISIVEGFEAQLLTEASSDDIEETTMVIDTEEEKKGFFSTIWNWFQGLLTK
ncbi:hypothetical protein [Alkalihalobacterium alkalinitrilicum]|uniref:hypothetical protein n=1 Tax=Alkalihalobacterium alkalinitrilicum TaxID=427920 RepID=UPI000994CEDC|nr:hypothetical protein [Alkalihalobacterium alkalinitrilicum]